LAILEIFAKKTVSCPIPFLQRDLQSDNPKIRETALKVLVRNPQKDSEKLLLKYLEDPQDEIRAEAASGLSLFVNDEVLLQLQAALKDPSWKVKIQAAASLKKMGEKGIAILKEQDSKLDKTSYEVAQYAMDFLD
jgi:HEAT repeat protein